ncbi:PAQR family membrane homeostasis protein TrhA [Membranihabitans marinus]|uniref:PAQR family membrane homeostasis protein TrhA n=1 Tax=Membranihabitans marinus TaxID=1227546 RepID=UPI001F029DC4|nr:hemolysin III family protein [Membranihabitans marinus]
MKSRPQTKREEYINFATHFLALIIFLWISPSILYLNTTENINYSVAVFLLGIFLSYFSSSIYHIIHPPTTKHLWRILDHIGIFFLIGGTYTPIVLYYLPPRHSMIFLIVQWSLIFLAAILKLWFTNKYHNISTIIYVFLGWMIVFIAVPMWKNTSALVLSLIAIGGVSYSVGVYFFKKDDKLYYHNIWHLFVIMGTACHYAAIYYMLTKG